jgi:hypothetical protein
MKTKNTLMHEPKRPSARLTLQRHGCKSPTGVMTVGNGTTVVLVYVLASIGLIIAFLLAAFVIGWFIDRLRERRRGKRGEE